MMAHNQSHKTDSRKPYVRIVTDKRREQNRKAQKAYRDRLKKKLEVLEEQAASALPRTSDSDSQYDILPTTEICIDDDDDDIASDEDSAQFTSRTDATLAAARSNPRIINLADAFAAAGDLPINQGSLHALQFQVAPTPEPEPDHSCEHINDGYGDMWMGEIWSMPKKSDLPHKQYPSPPGSKQGSRSSMTLTPRRTSSGVASPRSTLCKPLCQPHAPHW